MARLVSMLLRAARDSFPASRAARSAAAGAGLVHRSCPIAAFRPQRRGFAGQDASSEHPQRGCAAEDASSEHMLVRRSPHADPRLPLFHVHGVESSLDQHYDDEFVATEKDMESSEAMWALYVRWCEYFKEKRDHDEMVRLFPNFQKTVRLVHEVKNSNLPYRLEISEYADMKAREHTKRLTDEDFERYKAQGLLDESHLE